MGSLSHRCGSIVDQWGFRNYGVAFLNEEKSISRVGELLTSSTFLRANWVWSQLNMVWQLWHNTHIRRSPHNLTTLPASTNSRRPSSSFPSQTDSLVELFSKVSLCEACVDIVDASFLLTPSIAGPYGCPNPNPTSTTIVHQRLTSLRRLGARTQLP